MANELKTLAELLGNREPLKLRELHCHPGVANWLMLTSKPAPEPDFLLTGRIGALTGIPVFEEPEFEDGAWELREDGEVVKSGHVDVPYLARRIKVTFHHPLSALDTWHHRHPIFAQPEGE